MIKVLNIFCFSYAREWHEKLRELKESRAGLSLTVKSGPRSPGGGAVGGLQALVPSQTKPEITIKPAFKLLKAEPGAAPGPLKVDPHGALNLSTGSPSPELSSPTASATSPDTSGGRMSPGAARSPQGYRPPSYNSVELCVVCGDRASGECRASLVTRAVNDISRFNSIWKRRLMVLSPCWQWCLLPSTNTVKTTAKFR